MAFICKIYGLNRYSGCQIIIHRLAVIFGYESLPLQITFLYR